jgi:predicted nucleic acid-binding protein
MVLFDTNFLVHVLQDVVSGSAPTDKKLVDKLVIKLQQMNERILVTTPVLGEVLVYAGVATPKYLEILNKTARFKIAPFDEIAAIRAAEMLAADLVTVGKRGGAVGDWDVIKVDRQIVAIGIVEGVKTIYSNDPRVIKLGERAGMTAINFDRLETHLKPAPLFDQKTPPLNPSGG